MKISSITTNSKSGSMGAAAEASESTQGAKEADGKGRPRRSDRSRGGGAVPEARKTEGALAI